MNPDSPHVIAPPPFIFLAGLLVALLLHFWKPVSLVPPQFAMIVGILFIGTAMVITIKAVRAFAQAGTDVNVYKPSKKIVTTGPYRFTRNPIYLSMALCVLGIGIWVNTSWILPGLVLALIVVEEGVIKREERYLANKFGEEYLVYKRSVRRWV